MKRFLTLAILLVGFLPALLAAQPQNGQQNFFKLGMDNFNAGNLDAAIANFQKVVNAKPKPNAAGGPPAQNPKKADAYYFLGLCMAKKGNPGGAISNFSNAIEVRPAYPQARLE